MAHKQPETENMKIIHAELKRQLLLVMTKAVELGKQGLDRLKAGDDLEAIPDLLASISLNLSVLSTLAFHEQWCHDGE